MDLRKVGGSGGVGRPWLEAAEGDAGAIPASQAQPPVFTFKEDLVEGHIGGGVERTGVEEVNLLRFQNHLPDPRRSLPEASCC